MKDLPYLAASSQQISEKGIGQERVVDSEPLLTPSVLFVGLFSIGNPWEAFLLCRAADFYNFFAMQMKTEIACMILKRQRDEEEHFVTVWGIQSVVAIRDWNRSFCCDHVCDHTPLNTASRHGDVLEY